MALMMPKLVLALLLGRALAENMNRGVEYRVSNAEAGHEHEAFGFDPESEFFEVLSPPITSRYAQVVWRALEPVALPDAIVERYANATIAITGYEVDVVRGDALASVPSYELCVRTLVSSLSFFGRSLFCRHHHYTNFLRALARLADGRGPTSATACGACASCARAAATASEAPLVQAFSEHNGNEYRQSYHGLPKGYAQPLFAPAQMIFAPMQINLNDGSGTRGAGPLPAASAAPAGANYSGLLECPCTDRIAIDAAAGTIDGRPYAPAAPPAPRALARRAGQPDVRGGDRRRGGVLHRRVRAVDAARAQPAFVDSALPLALLLRRLCAGLLARLPPRMGRHQAAATRAGPRAALACRRIEYDVPRAPARTPPDAAVHGDTTTLRVRDMMVAGCDARLDYYCADAAVADARGGVKLVMAGGHCHAPACLDIELVNADTGERLCRVAPASGAGDAVYDEAGYVWLPPCAWADDDARLPRPPVLGLDTRLTSIKRVNSTFEHYGVMAIWQMRAAYAT